MEKFGVSMTFRPLLAATIKNHSDLHLLTYPMIASPKLDGIRVLIHPELGPVTRKLKPVPNRFVRSVLDHLAPKGLDGEITVGSATAKDVFNVTSSAVMSHDGEPEFTFHVFDDFTNPELSYKDRLLSIKTKNHTVMQLEHRLVHDAEQVLALEHEWLELGYEGVMLRSPAGRYKFNRSTFEEQILLKLKTFVDMEATVVGVEELMKNDNELQKDERGYSKRSTHQEKLFPQGVLGALVCECEEFTDVFKIGSGFTQEQRKEIWESDVLGKQVKFKYQDVGVKDRPRFPVFLGWRLD